MMLTLILMVCVTIATTTGRSTGPPLSSCATMNPQGHINSGFQAQDLGFTVSAIDFGSTFLITVTGSQSLKGIFIQVRDSGDNAVGTFRTDGVAGFQTLPCFNRNDSAFAHSDGSDKGQTVAVVWTPPDDCSGTMTVRATVVVAFITFQVGITNTLVCRPATEVPMTTEEPPPPPPVTTEEPPPPPPVTTEEQPPPPMTSEEPPPLPMTSEEPPPPPMTSEEPPPLPMTSEEPPPPPMTSEEPPPLPMTSEEPPPPPMTSKEPPPLPMTSEEPPPPPMTSEEPPPPPMTSEEPPPPPMTSEEPPPMTTEEAPMTQVPMTTEKMTPVAMETTEMGRVLPLTPSKLPSVMGVGCRYSALNNIPANKYSSSFETRSTGGWMLAGKRNPMHAFSPFRFFHLRRNFYRQPMWTRNKGPTPSRGTGPNSAANGNYYLYLEASDPMMQGDKVSLYTRSELRGCFCVQFYHHHNVQNFKRPYDQHKLTVHAGFRMKKLSRSKPHNSWQKVAVQFDEKAFTMVRIVGTRGKDWRGDMAIDNVSITSGMCPM